MQTVRCGRSYLIVSYSGVEHDGLGRYGDPLNPEGDLAAMHEMRLLLRSGGLLLLGIPISAHDQLMFPDARIYGPKRLKRLLVGFTLIGRTWNGRLVQGGLDMAPSIWRTGTGHWDYQPLLVLRRDDA